MSGLTLPHGVRDRATFDGLLGDESQLFHAPHLGTIAARLTRLHRWCSCRRCSRHVGLLVPPDMLERDSDGAEVFQVFSLPC